MPAIRHIYAKFNHGISILEMLITLVITSGIVGMSVYYYSTVTDIADFKEAINQFQSLASKLTSVSASSNSTYPTTKWGGVLTLSNINIGKYGSMEQSCNILINFSNMKRDTCIRLFNALNAASLSGDWHLYIGNTCPVSGSGPVTWIYTYPVCSDYSGAAGSWYYSASTEMYQTTP